MSESDGQSEEAAGGEAAARADTRAVSERMIQREAVMAMLERERRSLGASLISLALMCVAISLLPDPGWMFALLALRAASFLFTREAAAELDRRVRINAPTRTARVVLTFAMAGTGITLALLLWPQPADAPMLATALIQATVIVTVTLIAVTLAALPQPRDAMLLAFAITGSILVVAHPAVPTTLIILFVAISLGVRIYSASTGAHIVSAAAVLAVNRKLTDDLAEALSRAEYLSTRDPLTGLYNRRRLFDVGRSEDRLVKRHLLTIDLDHFKGINDRFGHAVGDKVLVAAAQTISGWMRALTCLEKPLAFRLGGEEFLVIVEGMGDEAVIAGAEDLRARLALIEQDFAASYGGLTTTASLGLTDWHPGERLDDALVRADLACYRAKQAGRNRVERTA